MCVEKLSADVETAENYVDELAKLVAEEDLREDLVDNADETSLLWHYIPRKTYATVDETAPMRIKNAKDKLTMLAYTNRTGTHKCKLLVIDKGLCPKAFKGVLDISCEF